eukprot:TRINITY_DN4373_c0_g3_i3.p2 TRINITY_DN4373_c0_g3~~TRINITY_DN4373_c0_g3_i3.p2  ORF type:complete len:129 (+),score=23.27 TRINITY_DN4373_c0_g3_i3:309-695(+)
MWDVGGQKAIRAHWKSYYESNDGLVYVIDAADKPRLEESRDELASLLQEDTLAGVPLLIFANKQDLLHAISPEDIVTSMGLEEIKDRYWSIFACSAQTGEGLQDGVQWLIETINECDITIILVHEFII